MGMGTEIARHIDLRTGGHGLHGAVLDNFKDQLLIVLLKRLAAAGERLDFPVAEVDDTEHDVVDFCIRERVFHFELRKKDYTNRQVVPLGKP